jgi:DNA-binding phage protein
MASTLDDALRVLKRRAKKAGPEAIALYEAADKHFAAEVARELALLRIEQKLSQVELGRRAALQQAEVSRLLSGRSDPRISTVQKLARAMGAELRLVRSTAARRVSLPARGRRSKPR